MAGHFPLLYSKAKIQTSVAASGGGKGRETFSIPQTPGGEAALFCNSLKVPNAPRATGRDTDVHRDDKLWELRGTGWVSIPPLIGLIVHDRRLFRVVRKLQAKQF